MTRWITFILTNNTQWSQQIKIKIKACFVQKGCLDAKWSVTVKDKKQTRLANTNNFKRALARACVYIYIYI